MMLYVLRAGFGLALVVGAITMLCNPDPRYADIPSYQETLGGGSAILVIIGLALICTAGER